MCLSDKLNVFIRYFRLVQFNKLRCVRMKKSYHVALALETFYNILISFLDKEKCRPRLNFIDHKTL